MNDDLISRKALLDVFRKNNIFEHITNAEDKNVIEIVKEQPTAYDVNKVIKLLEENNEDIIKAIEENSSSKFCMIKIMNLKELFEEYTREQIEIVRSGSLKK